MTLLVTPPKREVAQKDIVLVSHCPDVDALRAHRAMRSAEETVLEQALHMAGLTKSSVAVVNLFPESVSIAPFWQDSSQARKRSFKPAAEPWLARLHETLDELKPKVVVPLGEIPTRALTGRHDYTAIRGYPFPGESFLTVPSLHPKDMIWSNYEWRYYLSNDLRRAKSLADGSVQIVEPSLSIVSSVDEVRDYFKRIVLASAPTAFDIEVSNYEVSCIGFSGFHNAAITIPLDDRWSIEDETLLWVEIAKFLETANVSKITQNGLFDTYFLAYKMGIFTRGTIYDTMIASSVVFPDFLKGLGFLGSIHTFYTYWKDQGGKHRIKAED